MDNRNFFYHLQLIIKRIMDIILAITSLFFSLPFFLLIFIAIKVDSSGPVFFKHRRIGKDGRPFNLYKFRTMVIGADDSNYTNYLKDLIQSDKDTRNCGKPYRKMEHDERVTRVGSYLRCYYLDELPQFINILKGEMSLVGPRPHVQLEVDNYTPEQYKRLSVKPGATGMWQVAGKADCTFSELIDLDLEYIENWSIWLDIQIIYKTLEIFFHGGEKYWAQTDKVAKVKKIVSEIPLLEDSLDKNTNPSTGTIVPPTIHSHPTAKIPHIRSDS